MGGMSCIRIKKRLGHRRIGERGLVLEMRLIERKYEVVLLGREYIWRKDHCMFISDLMPRRPPVRSVGRGLRALATRGLQMLI